MAAWQPGRTDHLNRAFRPGRRRQAVPVSGWVMFKEFCKMERAMVFPKSRAQVTERKGNMARKQDRPTGEE